MEVLFVSKCKGQSESNALWLVLYPQILAKQKDQPTGPSSYNFPKRRRKTMYIQTGFYCAIPEAHMFLLLYRWHHKTLISERFHRSLTFLEETLVIEVFSFSSNKNDQVGFQHQQYSINPPDKLMF